MLSSEINCGLVLKFQSKFLHVFWRFNWGTVFDNNDA